MCMPINTRRSEKNCINNNKKCISEGAEAYYIVLRKFWICKCVSTFLWMLSGQSSNKTCYATSNRNCTFTYGIGTKLIMKFSEILAFVTVERHTKWFNLFRKNCSNKNKKCVGYVNVRLHFSASMVK